MFCSGCGSSWRVRAIALGVLIGIGSDWKPIVEIPANYFWRGLGTSEHMVLAGALSTKFDYTNSYYHRFPKLDLTAIEHDQRSFFGFVVCSDVLEHIPPNVDKALVGIADLLAPHGFAVLSVPTGGATFPTKEFYPDLVDWTEVDGTVEWWDSQGNRHLDPNPEYHGGAGQTLAFRVWGSDDFRRRLTESGMRNVTELPSCDELGVPQILDHGVFVAQK